MLFLFYFTILLFIYSVKPYTVISPNYKIPQYYGSFDQDFFQRNIVYASNRSTFYLKSTIDYDEANEAYYIASSNKSAIYKVDKDNNFVLLAGNPEESGFRNGDMSSALFTNITSIVYLKKQLYQAEKESKFSIFIIKDINNNKCADEPLEGYTNTEDPKPSSYISYSEIIDLDNYTVDNVAPNCIRQVYEEPNPTIDTSLYDEPVLFVSDSGNHCIRKIYLEQEIVETYAGKCEVSGFKDGPTVINRFYYPGMMGVNNQGILIVYDIGNSYMRFINITGYVETFKKGACRQDVRYSEKQLRSTSSYTIKPVICDLNWNKFRGEPSEHIFEETIYSICTQQQLECET